MSLGDEGKQKDIRQRANDFLTHGVLGCCPETKAALGKTVAEGSGQKQPEKALPNVVNTDGRRYDKKAKYEPGMELNLFPTTNSRNSLSGEANFGWMKADNRSEEERTNGMVEKLQKLADGPRVVQEVWEVDKDGNPTKLVTTSEDDQEEEIEAKGLGRTLREMNPGNTLIARAAKRFGVWVDDLGKFRCPPGTPQANQFTDEFGTTCFAVSASQLANAAQEGFASLGGWWKKWQQRKLPFYIDEYGNVTENIDIIEGRQEYQRVFTGSRARVRERMSEMEGTVDDLLRIHGIKKSTGDNRDIMELILKLSDEMGGDIQLQMLDLDAVWNGLTKQQQARLMARGINKQALVDSERGFLMKLAEMSVTDPERFKRIGTIVHNDSLDAEGYTSLQFDEAKNPKVLLSKTTFKIQYNAINMANNVVNELEDVRENQRLGLRVVGAGSDEEAADALHKFVTNENQWAGGMTASLGKNPFMAKGAHTGAHEVSHTIQYEKFIEKAMEMKGASVSAFDLDGKTVTGMMVGMGDDIDLEDLGLVLSDLEKVAFIGGAYGANNYYESGAVSELWKIETTAELYALREMGVIEGDDIDAALSWMDSSDAARSTEMRRAKKKKEMKIREKAAQRPQTRPDGRRDHPDSPAPRKPRKARPVKDAKSADRIGKSMRKEALDKLEPYEREAVERIGDPRSHQITSLVNPDEMMDAILSIDSSHKLARKHGVDLDEVDVSESKAVERVAYDPKRERLYVTYRGREGEPGRTYYYRDVSPEVVLELHKAETKGKAINEIKRTHDFVKTDKIPEKIDRKSLDDGDIASQAQFNLIPTLTALDKSEVGREMRVVVTVNKDKSGGEVVEVRGITTARIYHDGMPMKDDEVVLSVPADGRGIPVVAGEFDREPTGSTSLLMMPPMKIAVLDDKDGRRAELVDQSSSDQILERMMDDWPVGGDAKEGRIINSSRRRVEEVVASHSAMGEGSDRLTDGSTSPISARRIRTRNADVHDRQTRRRSSPTKPTKEYRDTVVRSGFKSMGKIETPEERSFGRSSGHAMAMNSIRIDASIDPEIQRIVGSASDRQVSEMIESAAVGFHEGVDRRPRLRVSDTELDKVLQDGGRSFTDRGYFSSAEKSYQALFGIHPDTDDIDRPISGYIVHPAQEQAARNAMRRRGIQVGEGPIEWPLGQNPHGDIDTDGEIEIVLKPEVSGRTAYGFGYGIDNQTRPVWLNSSDPAAISDALVHVDPTVDADGSRVRVLNALAASIDGDYGSMTDVASVKPVATRQTEKTPDFIRRNDEHAKATKPQRLGAHIMGGFVNEEISEVRYPWSKVSKSSSDIDISDVVYKEPVSDRLRRLGFSDEEIEYFYSVNGDRSLDYISSATMASLKEYRKAMELKRDYESRGIPSVAFSHPSGMDPLDVSSYSDKQIPGMTVEDALAAAINEEVDALVEKMLKQVRKTKGRIWEMNPKAGVSA